MLKLSRLDTAGPDFERRLADLLAFENTQDASVDRVAGEILADVKQRGDSAVLDYTRRFDRLDVGSMAALELSQTDVQRALGQLPDAQRDALVHAAGRIRSYHESGQASHSLFGRHGRTRGQGRQFRRAARCRRSGRDCAPIR